MPSTLNPACPPCGLRFENKPLLDLHIREDHRQRVPRAQDGHRDPGSTRVAAPPADGPPHGHDGAPAPSLTTKEATARTTRHRHPPGRAITALLRALRAVRNISDEPLRASGAAIRPARARQARPQTPAPPGGQRRKAQERTATERADRDDCLICRACVSF